MRRSVERGEEEEGEEEEKALDQWKGEDRREGSVEGRRSCWKKRLEKFAEEGRPNHKKKKTEIDLCRRLVGPTYEHWKALSINRALLLYNMSHFMLKYGLSDQYRDPCYTLANFQRRDVLTWLLRAFIFSREFPLLLQKVSRLLASTLILSTVDCSIPLPLHRVEVPQKNQNEPRWKMVRKEGKKLISSGNLV
ncbi:separase [Carex littledalei]|uniref:Separase n=1 Tax=Carex littledalei TaxID=544730 RepID=A0A833VS21_9POAL|nr:separase [Carex littledalei]